MKTQWPHAAMNHGDERRDTGSLDERRRMRTRSSRCAISSFEAERLRVVVHIGAFGRVRNSSVGAPRDLATSLEVNRETGWRDNKLCRRPRDICSCLHFIGGYPASSNKRTNGLIRNNNDAAGCGQWGR